MNKIVVVGCGNVGCAYSYAVLNQSLNIDELILIDVDNKKALGHAMDLSHTALYLDCKTKVRAGSYMDCKGADIVVICAGANQKSNETRLELTTRNSKIIKEIVKKVVTAGFKGIFLLATNPVDIMTYMTKIYSNFDTSKVIGSGTTLDTARLTYYLSDKLNVNQKDIEVYVLGEHGDSSFVPWSSARIGSLDIQDIILKSDLKQIENKVKKLAYKIIDLKQETSFGIGCCLARITKAIINDEYAVLPVSAPYDGVYMGMPAVICKKGIKGVMKIKLTNEEAKALEKSKDVLKEIISSLEE